MSFSYISYKNISKKIELLINILKLISSKIKDESYIKFSNIVIRLTFISKNSRIKISHYKTLINLSDYDIKRFKLGADKGYLALYLINNFNLREKDILKKLSFLISYSRYQHCALELLIKKIDSMALGLNDLKDMLFTLPAPFAIYGDYERFEDIIKFLRKKIDTDLNRKVGIHNESSYLTAIGHMCHLTYLLKAVDIGFINKKEVPINIIKAREGPANNEFFKLINAKCHELGIEIRLENYSYSKFEPELELWPTQSNDYIFGRHVIGLIDYYWEFKKGKTNFLRPLDYQLETAKEILKKHYGSIPKNFVGMHLRVSKDEKSVRNINKLSAKYAVEQLTLHNLDCYLIGTKSFFEKKKSSLYEFLKYKNVFDTTKLKLSKFERECLQIYIWSHSRFFIGSKSGGTNPAGTFGIPTIWLDTHPNIDFRSPNRLDHILPKRVFSSNEDRYLSFEELFKEENLASQSTDIDYVRQNGFKIESCEKLKIKMSIEEMIKMTAIKTKPNKSNGNIEVFNNEMINIDKNLKKFKFGGKYFF